MMDRQTKVFWSNNCQPYKVVNDSVVHLVIGRNDVFQTYLQRSLFMNYHDCLQYYSSFVGKLHSSSYTKTINLMGAKVKGLLGELRSLSIPQQFMLLASWELESKGF